MFLYSYTDRTWTNFTGPLCGKVARLATRVFPKEIGALEDEKDTGTTPLVKILVEVWINSRCGTTFKIYRISYRDSSLGAIFKRKGAIFGLKTIKVPILLYCVHVNDVETFYVWWDPDGCISIGNFLGDETEDFLGDRFRFIEETSFDDITRVFPTVKKFVQSRGEWKPQDFIELTLDTSHTQLNFRSVCL